MSFPSKRMTILLAAFVTAFVPLYLSGDNSEVIRNPWNETNLDFGFIERRVTTEACRMSEVRYLSCIAALSAMLNHTTRRLDLVHANWRPGADYATSPVARFGSLVVVEKRTSDFRLARNALKEVKARRQRILEWQAEYRHGRGEIGDFDRALVWFFSHVVEVGRTQQYAAAAINGYISIQDAHARIFPAAAFARRPQAGTGSYDAGANGRSYTGIGVAVQRVAGTIMVTSVVKNGPASHVGLRAGDVILAVDGQPVDDKPLPKVVSRLRGPAGSRVALAVQSQNARKDVSLQRGAVEVKNVTSAVVDGRAYRWGNLSVHSFAEPNTCAEARRELRVLIESDVDGILLDVRNNLGGLIDQAVCVADLFLGRRLAVVELRSVKNQQRNQTLRTRYPAMTRLPLVTLVNAGTGSASEVLLGALRDHGRALIVGERTFGKGTMQTVRPWSSASGIMQLFTTAVMHSPSGRSMQMLGIEPDLTANDRPYGYSAGKVVLREEDLFPMALPAVSPQAPEVVGNWNISRIRRCVSVTGAADQRWSDAKVPSTDNDYVSYVGQDVLRCLTTSASQSLTLR